MQPERAPQALNVDNECYSSNGDRACHDSMTNTVVTTAVYIYMVSVEDQVDGGMRV